MKERKVVSNNFLKGFDTITGKDVTRPIMMGVCFDDGFAIATDAHKLVKVDMQFYGLSFEDRNILDGYFMSNDVLKECKASIGQRVEIDEDCIVFISGISEAKRLKLTKTESLGKYPNVNAVIPKQSKAIDRFGLNYQYALDIQKVYTAICDMSELITTTHGEGRAITIKSKDGLFFSLIMPILIK